MSGKAPEIETRDRVRRIETRLTQTMIALGIRTDVKRPEFSCEPGNGGNATLSLPSVHSSAKEIIDSIPDTCDGPVKVVLGNNVLFTVCRDGGLGG